MKSEDENSIHSYITDNEFFKQTKGRSYAFNEDMSEDIADLDYVVIEDETKNK